MVVRSIQRSLQDAGLRMALLILSWSAIFPTVAFGEYPSVPGEYVVEVSPQQGSGPSIESVATPTIDGAAVVDTLNNEGTSLKIKRETGIESSLSGEEFCADLIKRNPGVVTACSPNYIIKLSNTTPNDPSLSSLWGMSAATGIDAPRAWDYTQGSTDVVVATIDTGVDYNHPDLSGNIWSNPGEVPGNGLDDDNNGYVDDVHGINAAAGSGNPMDDNGHGSHVSGTMGALGNNNVGVVGVNWHVKIMGLKFLDSQGSGSISDAIKAINYMVMMKNRGINIKVANNSWGGGGYSQSLYNAIQHANQAGIIFAAAAGNEANDNDASPSYPASYDLPNVVSVAAVDSQGNLASFSNYGITEVDIAAPGVNILSTTPGNHYSSFSGTSMATPHVAGALALLFAHEAGLSVADAINRMYESGKPLSSLTGSVRTGRLLNVGRMLAGDTSPVAEPSPGPACDYTVSEIGDAPNTSADQSDVVISSDEMNYYTVSLPFSVTWDGGDVSSITLSPNGVVYMNHNPSSWDYQNGQSAPRNAIAALHSDLYPVGGDYGVRVATGSDSVTVSWTATHYAVKSGYVVVRLTIHADGTIESWYSFSDSTIESFLKNNATVGVHGSTDSSIATYSKSDGKLHDGLGIRFTPSCTASRPLVREVHIAGEGSRGKAVPKVTPGKRFALSVFGSGSGLLKLHFAIGSQQCKDTATESFVDGYMHLRGRVPKGISGAASLSVKVDGYNKQSKVKLKNVITQRRSTKRLTTRALSSACKVLMGSLS